MRHSPSRSALFEFTSGKFGGSVRIDELSLPFTLSYQRERLGFKLVLPYLRVTGPAYAVPIGGGATVCEDRSGNSGASSGRSGRGSRPEDCGDDGVTSSRVTRSSQGDALSHTRA